MTKKTKLKKFQFHVTFERVETVQVEAKDIQEARELVMEGEYDDMNVVDINHDFVEMDTGFEVRKIN